MAIDPSGRWTEGLVTSHSGRKSVSGTANHSWQWKRMDTAGLIVGNIVTTKSSNQQNVGKNLVPGNSRLTEALRTPKWPYISTFHSDERSLLEELLRRTITYGSGKGWKQLALALAILVTTKSSNQQNVGKDLAPGNLRLTEGLRTPKWP